MSAPLVTFLCPSRGRPESLRKSIESLRATAYDPDCFEVLVYLDDDDPTVDEWPGGYFYSVGDTPLPLDLRVREWRMCVDVQERHFVGISRGYARLHECIAELIPYSRALWLWLWNDDALMTTERWDIKLRKYPPNLILNPDTNHQSHATGLNVFPVVPTAWVELVGWARDGANDTWWQFIAQHLQGRQVDLPVYITHDRSDLTGGHDDDTRAGNNYDPSTFWSDATQAEILADAMRIKEVFGS